MQTKGCVRSGWGIMVGGLMCHLLTGGLEARPRPPLPPYPETILNAFTFDAVYYQLGSQAPAVVPAADLVESWSGYALRREGVSVTPFVVPAIAADGKPNFAPAEGTIRLWFRPSWASAALSGTGPTVAGRLLEVGTWGGERGTGCWSLQFSPAGDAISLVAQGADDCEEIVTAPIQWEAGQWHQVALAYSPGGCWLFLDGRLAAQGPGVSLASPDGTPGGSGFCLGSDASGLNLALGHFDEVTAFASVQGPDQIAWNYSCFAGVAALGPITLEEDAVRLARIEATAFSGAQTMSDSGGPPLPPGGGGTNGAPWTNCWAWAKGLYYGTNLGFWSIGYVVTNLTTNVYLTITNNTPTNTYDFYVSTNLNSVPFWDGATQAIAWRFVTNLPAGSNSLTLSNFTDWSAWFALCLHTDTDGDGLWDGDEIFLYKTDPTKKDTDGDGLTDDWEIAFGLCPLLDDSGRQQWRFNYTYDAAGRLTRASGIRNEGTSLDGEGNLLQISQ